MESSAQEWGESSQNPDNGNPSQTQATTQEELQTGPPPGARVSQPQQSTIQSAANKDSPLGPEPTKKQFNIPTTEEAYERMVDRFATVGMKRWEVDKVIETKTTAFNKACREHKKSITELKKKADINKVGKYTRKNSMK